MLAAATLSLMVTLAMVSVPRLIYGAFLGPGWQTPAYGQWARSAAVLIFCVELVVLGAIGLAAGATVGAAALVVEAAYFGNVVARARRLQAACNGLLERTTREASVRVIERELELRRRKGERSLTYYGGYARTAMVLAKAIDSAGMTRTAISTIDGIDEGRLDPVLRAMRAQNLAAFLLREGERLAARDVLSRVPRPVSDPVYEDAILALDTLLVAIEGDPGAAEAQSRAGIVRARQPAVLAAWQAGLAHALAAQGLRQEAAQLLRDMRQAHGVVSLDRVVRHCGPASLLAESVLGEGSAPYR